MKKTLLSLSIALAGTALATPFTGNDAASNAMGNTGVASANPQNAFQFNPGLLADYPDSKDFGLTLPAVKFFIDDSKGLVKNGEEFISGGAWEDFQTIDADAFNTAVFGDGGSEPAMTAVLANIVTDISNITAAITAITAQTDSGNQPNAGDITSLNNASTSLSSNATLLDNKVGVADTQADNLATTVDGTLEGLLGFNDKPLQLGLGIDVLNVAIPSETLALAFSFSTNTTVGTSVNISDTDFEPVEDLSDDLTAITARASALTASMNTLADANLALTAHISTQPDPADYTGGVVNLTYIADITAWGNTLETLATAVDTAQTDVNTKLNELTGFDGNYVSNGDVTPPTVGDLTSEVEFVGANISELGVSVARRFVVYGEEIAVGVTPKLQSINIFEKTIGLATVEDDISSASSDPAGYFLENTTMLYRANIDVGVAKTWDFYGRVRAGAALKDIIPWTLESDAGTELLIRPKLRIGAAHETSFSKLAVDLDITENKPLKYGVPTRYFGLGGELNAFGWASLRAGYRANLSVEDSHVISGGIGFTPFGTGLEVSAWAKPKFDDPTTLIQDAGAVVQFSVNF